MATLGPLGLRRVKGYRTHWKHAVEAAIAAAVVTQIIRVLTVVEDSYNSITSRGRDIGGIGSIIIHTTQNSKRDCQDCSSDTGKQ